MDSDNTTASYHRKSRLVVSHGGTEEIREINRNIDNLTDITSARNPSGCQYNMEGVRSHNTYNRPNPITTGIQPVHCAT